jgi:hypothetical protein
MLRQPGAPVPLIASSHEGEVAFLQYKRILREGSPDAEFDTAGDLRPPIGGPPVPPPCSGTEGRRLTLIRSRKADLGVRFTEMPEIAAGGRDREHGWKCFAEGRPIRRTLCDEQRVSFCVAPEGPKFCRVRG